MHRIWIVFLGLAFGCNLLLAAPARRDWRTITQPDGSTITVRQMGDEFFHYWENEAGQPVAKDTAGWWNVLDEPVKQSEESKRLQASHHYNQESTMRKSPGKINLAPRGLVILVQFSDSTFKPENDRTSLSDMLNKPGYNYHGATGSAADYFKAQSDTAYTPVFDVIGPVTLANSAKYYGEQNLGPDGIYDTSDDGYSDIYIADFVIDAVKAAENLGCDFSQYDADNNGEVDIVYLIYAGRGQNDGGGPESIWPHNWKISSALSWGYTHGTSGYSSSNLPKFDNKTINSYVCSGELDGVDERAGIGTFCHEFSHVLGLPDFYVTASTASNIDKDYTPAAWHIMDYGLYNNDGLTPPNYSPHDKLYFGWATPTFLAKDATVKGELTTEYGSAYQITGTTTSAGATSTSRVWYLENRQKKGWDAWLPGHGMLVWEVVYNSSNWTNNKPNNSTVGYTVVTANQQTRPYVIQYPDEYKTTKSSSSATTFPGTGGVTSYTPAEGCALTNIRESNGLITFKYNSTTWDYTLYGENCTYPDDGEINKGEALVLTIIPDAGYALDDEACWDVMMGDDILIYGEDFTYDASTNTFFIESLTGDVDIIIEATYTGDPTSMDSITNDPLSIPRKILRDGQLFIIRGNKIYTLTGQELR